MKLTIVSIALTFAAGCSSLRQVEQQSISELDANIVRQVEQLTVLEERRSALCAKVCEIAAVPRDSLAKALPPVDFPNTVVTEPAIRQIRIQLLKALAEAQAREQDEIDRLADLIKGICAP